MWSRGVRVLNTLPPSLPPDPSHTSRVSHESWKTPREVCVRSETLSQCRRLSHVLLHLIYCCANVQHTNRATTLTCARPRPGPAHRRYCRAAPPYVQPPVSSLLPRSSSPPESLALSPLTSEGLTGVNLPLAQLPRARQLRAAPRIESRALRVAQRLLQLRPRTPCCPIVWLPKAQGQRGHAPPDRQVSAGKVERKGNTRTMAPTPGWPVSAGAGAQRDRQAGGRRRESARAVTSALTARAK